MSKDDGERFYGDAKYACWMNGGNPDSLDRTDCRDARLSGYSDGFEYGLSFVAEQRRETYEQRRKEWEREEEEEYWRRLCLSKINQLGQVS